MVELGLSGVTLMVLFIISAIIFIALAIKVGVIESAILMPFIMVLGILLIYLPVSNKVDRIEVSTTEYEINSLEAQDGELKLLVEKEGGIIKVSDYKVVADSKVEKPTVKETEETKMFSSLSKNLFWEKSRNYTLVIPISEYNKYNDLSKTKEH